ncbi:MAG: type III-B CRISPR module RAMP protein Cmr6 [Sphingobacteriia bacterium]|nr:type III-B CRISPR module RAMP protein Cmr6 [Sphingobacteriia bacterium]
MPATQLMREALRPLYRQARDAHPGLLIQRGYAVDDRDTEDGRKAKTQHIVRVCSVPSGAFYQNAYHRWRKTTADPVRFRQIELALESRLFIGLTGGGMLETGCAISHSYGTPYIPGSSIKGVVRAHVHGSAFGREHPEVIAELFGADANSDGPHPKGLSGLVSFHDAWWVPGSADMPLVEEIVTTHHLDYYSSEGKTPATDFDSPIPNAQIAVRGAFLFVLEGPLGWLELAQKMLISALSKHGIGAKARTGYGLFDPQPKVPAEPKCDWVDETIEKLKVQNKAGFDDTLRGKDLAAAWSELSDQALKSAALNDIRSRWHAKGWWESPPGKAAKQKAIYESEG